MGQPDNQTLRDGRMGWNAWLALGAGVLLWSILIGASIALQKITTGDEVFTCVAVGFSSLVGCGCWSVALAVRALRRGERQTLPVALLVLVSSVVLAVVGVGTWSAGGPELLIQSYLTVFLPLAAFVLLTVTPVLLLVLWRKKRGRVARSETELSRGERWRIVRIWGGLYALLCLIVLGLPLVYLQAVQLSTPIIKRGEWITGNTPDAFRDAVEQVAHAGSGGELRTLEYKILSQGLVSPERLVSRAFDPDRQFREAAQNAMARLSPGRLADLALEIERGERAPPTGLSLQERTEITSWIVRFGTAGQQRGFLRSVSGKPKGTLEFLDWMRQSKLDPAMRPEIETFMSGSVQEQTLAFFVLIAMEPEGGRRAFIRKTIRAAKSEFINSVLSQIYFSGHADDGFLIIWETMDLSQPKMKELALESRFFSGYLRSQTVVSENEVLRKMLAFLADGTSEIKRIVAAQLLMNFMNRDDSNRMDERDRRLWQFYKNSLGRSFRNLPQEEGEEAVFESLRKKVEAMLVKPKGSK